MSEKEISEDGRVTGMHRVRNKEVRRKVATEKNMIGEKVKFFSSRSEMWNVKERSI